MQKPDLLRLIESIHGALCAGGMPEDLAAPFAELAKNLAGLLPDEFALSKPKDAGLVALLDTIDLEWKRSSTNLRALLLTTLRDKPEAAVRPPLLGRSGWVAAADPALRHHLGYDRLEPSSGSGTFFALLGSATALRESAGMSAAGVGFPRAGAAAYFERSSVTCGWSLWSPREHAPGRPSRASRARLPSCAISLRRRARGHDPQPPGGSRSKSYWSSICDLSS